MSQLHTVNFGAGKTGLLTVGYTLYNQAGTTYQARTTSGVVEFGSSGVYGAAVTLPSDRDVLILWDSGEASPRYGSEDGQVQFNTIQTQTSEISKIWNSLKNQGEFVAVLMEKLGLMEKNVGLTKPDVQEIIQKEVSKLTKFPEYDKFFNGIEASVSLMKASVEDKVKEIKTSSNFKSLEMMVKGQFSDKMTAMQRDLVVIKGLFERFDVIVQMIKILNDKLNKLDVKDKTVINERQKIEEEMKRLNTLIDMISRQQGSQATASRNELLSSLGHRIK